MSLPSVQVISPAGEHSLCSPAAAERLASEGWTLVATANEAETEVAASKKKPAAKKKAAPKPEPEPEAKPESDANEADTE